MKAKKVKRRIPTAPPTKKHKTKKDYNRKSLGQELIESLRETLYDNMEAVENTVQELDRYYRKKK